ncbi:MAG: 50S ribosomal protein L19 [Candidatus Falkowbacteria bacterium]|nr:50S ribosomal protein L19 [Candidatus Falkowbacteria bacterium]
MSDEIKTVSEEITEDKQIEEIKTEEPKVSKKSKAKKGTVDLGDGKEEKLELKPGMTVRIHERIKELNTKGEEKQRVQYYEGMIIAKRHGKEAGGSITVRKISDGIGVEKIFPLNLTTITKIEIKKQADVRQAKLGYIKRGHKKKIREVRVDKVYMEVK